MLKKFLIILLFPLVFTVVSVTDNQNLSSSNHYGYWVWSNNMQNLDLDDLSDRGVSDIFLNFKAYEKYGIDGLELWISKANKKNIHVHFWIQVFWPGNDNKWVKPVINGKPNTEFFNKKIDEIKKYSKIKGISGIHFDYLRFSGSKKYNNAAWQNIGGKEAVSAFVKKAVKAIHNINTKIIVSAAIMPEPDNLENVYGDEYSVLSEYLDVIIPMVYCGNYNQDTKWVKATTKWFVENSNKAEVWTGLQAYKSDDDLTHLSSERMKKDINAALSGGASGVILFRYGVSDNINFKH